MGTSSEDYFREEWREGFFIENKMKRAWAAELEVLEEIDRICKKHKIQYFADSGTFLGAVRHQGFIPWDDDLDIVLLKRDCKRLERILERLDSEEYVYHSMRTDVEYVNTFGKFVSARVASRPTTAATTTTNGRA